MCAIQVSKALDSTESTGNSGAQGSAAHSGVVAHRVAAPDGSAAQPVASEYVLRCEARVNSEGEARAARLKALRAQLQSTEAEACTAQREVSCRTVGPQNDGHGMEGNGMQGSVQGVEGSGRQEG